jgi:hypothetical protein
MQGAWLRAAIKAEQDFKEQVPQWLSLKEKYRLTAAAIAAHMTRSKSRHSTNARIAVS